METKIYVHKFLANAGCGSRRNMVEAMKNGQVKVNNRTIQDPTFMIDPSYDIVTLGKKLVKAIPPRTYLMLNKPTGYITTNQDPQHRQTVFDLVPELYADRRLFAIGRLDADTEGLLILTNDGDLGYKLTHPKFEHEKEYQVVIPQELSTRQIRMFERGIDLEDGKTAPAIIRQVFTSQQITYHLTIHEGRKRQVRRMFDKLDDPVLKLKRVRIGQLWLDPKLKPGSLRELTASELISLAAKGLGNLNHPVLKTPTHSSHRPRQSKSSRSSISKPHPQKSSSTRQKQSTAR